MVLVIGALAYGTIQVVDQYRAKNYRQAMAHGTFYLIAKGVERYDDDNSRRQWLKLVSQLVGSDIQLLRSNEVVLSHSEKRELADNKVVLRLDETGNQADIFYALLEGEYYIQTQMAKVSEAQARATALLVLDALGHASVAEWPDVMKELKSQFGFPLYYQSMAQTHLDREQMHRLQRREVVLSIDDSNSRSGSSVTIYASIGESGQVLVMGPLYLFDPYPVEILALIGLIGLLLLALAAYFLVRPLQTRLMHLEQVIKRLGEGDLTAQADVNSKDAIGRLAATFNGMSRHIRRLIESQREMTRAVSHELRTPVARIRFGLEILADSDDNDSADKAARFDAIDRDIEELDTLIDEILTYARLEEGAPTPNFIEINIPDLLLRIRDELQPISKGCTIEVAKQALSLPAHQQTAFGEKRYLHRVLQNLVTNAVRYGNSRVLLNFEVKHGMACLIVDDDGEGIPADERSRVFEPFARLDQSRHHKTGGYGLGLSIVQRIAEWHGGKASVHQSELGGASFQVSWPQKYTPGQHNLGQISK